MAKLFLVDRSDPIPGPSEPDLPAQLNIDRPMHWNDAATHIPLNLAELQSLVNSFGTTLNAGDIIELNSSNIYSGRLIIPANCKGTFGNEIIFRTSSWVSLPSEGVRVAEVDSSIMPTMEGIVGVDSVTKRVLDLPCSTDNSGGASYLRFIGLDFTTVAAAQTNFANLIIIGSDQVTVADQPKNIILDQCLVHGNTATNFGNAVLMDCAEGGVVDSRIYEVHRTNEDGGVAWRTNGGAGPFKVQNNFLEASGMLIILSDQFEHTTQPQDITIRRNHMTKDESWDGVWDSKNIFETKWCDRVLVEENVCTNCSWSNQTSGDTFFIKCSGVVGGTTHLVKNVTIRWNLCFNNEAAISIQNADDAGAGGVSEILIHDNLFYDIGQIGNWNAGFGIGYKDFTIRNNTIVSDNSHGNGRHPDLKASSDCRDMTIIDNIFDSLSSTYFRRDSFSGGSPSLNASFVGNYFLTFNLLTGASLSNYNSGAQVGSKAENNLSPANSAAIGYVDLVNDDYELDSGSTYINASSVGGFPGCDVATLNSKVAGVV